MEYLIYPKNNKSPKIFNLRDLENFVVQKVELEGVEPSSKQETNMVSTCLSVYWLSGSGWQAAADLNLIPLRVRFGPGKGLPAILV